MRKINFERFRTANHQSLRSTNRAIVLNFIRSHQPISRVEISKRTGLQRSTVSLIVDELIRRGFVLERRATSLRRGGVPRLLSINVGKDYTIGVDIEVSQTTVALADLMGNIVDREVFATPAKPGEAIAPLAECVGRLVAPVGWKSLRSVGIAVSGLVDHDAGTVLLASNLGWTNFPLGQRLQRRLGASVLVDNEANLSALAEIWHGDFSNRSCPDLLFVNVKEGIGTGIVISGVVYRGFNSLAAEFGHMIIQPDGPTCQCGNRGCWETLADDRATVQRYLVQAPSFKPGGAGVSYPASIETVVQLALEGQKEARTALTQTARYLALGIQNIIVGLSPEFVVIAGAITRAWALLIPEIEAQMRRRLHGFGHEPVHVVPTSFREKPSLVGAISLGIAEYFGVPSDL